MGGSFALRVAWRYIFSRKSTNAINIISGITMLGITIGSAALIIVLSAFNGFGSLVIGLYGAFYPDITITPAQGKVFNANPDMMEDLGNIPGVLYISQTLEENAMLAYNEQEHIATIKGVDSIYSLVTAVDDSVFAGEYVLRFEHFGKEVDCAILGSGVAATLNVALGLGYP
nr:ABC transporter permease [Chitinophagales bacterium]